MYLEVYPDVVFLLNFFINLILIFLLKKLNKKNGSKIRLILAALAGAGAAAILSCFPWMNYLLKLILMYLATSLLMIIIAFGKLKLIDLLKQWVSLNLITYFLGGFMNAIYYHTNFRLYLLDIGRGNIFSNIPILYILVSAGLIFIIMMFLLWLYRLYQLHKPLIYDVELVLNNHTVKAKGLMDTGNCLYDPLLNKPVMVMDNSLIEQLATPEIKHSLHQARSFMEGKMNEIDEAMDYKTDDLYRFSFIPYRSIGKCGMLLGIRLDKVMIHTGKETICNENVTAAISDNLLTDNRCYQVILHRELL